MSNPTDSVHAIPCAFPLGAIRELSNGHFGIVEENERGRFVRWGTCIDCPAMTTAVAKAPWECRNYDRPDHKLQCFVEGPLGLVAPTWEVGAKVKIARPKFDMWKGAEAVVERVGVPSEAGPLVEVRLEGERSNHLLVQVTPDALDRRLRDGHGAEGDEALKGGTNMRAAGESPARVEEQSSALPGNRSDEANNEGGVSSGEGPHPAHARSENPAAATGSTQRPSDSRPEVGAEFINPRGRVFEVTGHMLDSTRVIVRDESGFFDTAFWRLMTPENGWKRRERAKEAWPRHCGNCPCPVGYHDDQRRCTTAGCPCNVLRVVEGPRSKTARPDDLEHAFWRFDALHKAHYRNADPSLPGPMSEREAFKRVATELTPSRLPDATVPANVLEAARGLVEYVERSKEESDLTPTHWRMFSVLRGSLAFPRPETALRPDRANEVEVKLVLTVYDDQGLVEHVSERVPNDEGHPGKCWPWCTKCQLLASLGVAKKDEPTGARHHAGDPRSPEDGAAATARADSSPAAAQGGAARLRRQIARFKRIVELSGDLLRSTRGTVFARLPEAEALQEAFDDALKEVLAEINQAAS